MLATIALTCYLFARYHRITIALTLHCLLASTASHFLFARRTVMLLPRLAMLSRLLVSIVL